MRYFLKYQIGVNGKQEEHTISDPKLEVVPELIKLLLSLNIDHVDITKDDSISEEEYKGILVDILTDYALKSEYVNANPKNYKGDAQYFEIPEDDNSLISIQPGQQHTTVKHEDKKKRQP